MPAYDFVEDILSPFMRCPMKLGTAKSYGASARILEEHFAGVMFARSNCPTHGTPFSQHVVVCPDCLAARDAEIERLRKDAERWRYLHKMGTSGVSSSMEPLIYVGMSWKKADNWLPMQEGDALDAAIDAAMDDTPATPPKPQGAA